MSFIRFGMGLLQVSSIQHCAKWMALALNAVFLLSAPVSAQVLFEEKTATAGPFHTGESWGASWGDLNGDRYPDLFVSNHGMTTSLYRNNGDGTFTDVIASADLDQKLVKPGDFRTNLADLHGGTWADFDNDGDQDLFVARSSEDGQLFLFENDGTGKFSQNHSDYGIPIDDTLAGRMAILFDYNNDGFLDFTYAANGSAMPLFKRQGTNFVYAQNQAGINGQCTRNHYGFTSRLFDTGNLVYVCMEASRIAQRAYDTSTIPFTDITDSIDHIGTWSDAILADVDNDARLDLIATTGKSRPNGIKRINSGRIESWLSISSGQEKKITFKSQGPITVNLYSRKVASRNQTTDQYDRVVIGSNGQLPTSLPVTLDPQNPDHQGVRTNRNPLGAYMGYDPAAQEWTIYLSAASNSDLVLFTFSGTNLTEPTLTGLTGVDGPRTPKILLNNGTRLQDVPGAKGLESVLCGAVVAEDFDNDMDVDLYMVCRTSLENLANRMYWNDGDGTFTPGTLHGAEGIIGSGIDGGAGTGEMAVTADYDVDGFMDIFVTNGNRLFPHFRKDGFTAGGPDQLFRNTANNSNHWLQIDLEGVNSNRDGYGTLVKVTAGGITQLREQNGKYHRWSQDHQRLHFGLASHTTATVTIEWPDGTVDVHNNVAADKLYLAIQDGSLQDQDVTGQGVVINISDQTVTEGGSAVMQISLSKPASKNVVVDYATANGSATAGSDFTPRSGTIVFSPGQTVKTRTVTTLQDTRVEGTEQFSMVLSNPANASLGNATGTATINDDDVPAGVTISISDQTVTEGGKAVMRISLSQPAAQNVVVNYATQNGSAKNGLDYTARSGVIVFSPGQTEKTRTVTTLQDSLIEGAEQFTMVLSNVVNATLADSVATATINDDDIDPGNTVCGEPDYDRSTDRGMFLWRDCAGDNTWHVRVTSGGSSQILNYSGELVTNKQFYSVQGVGLESTDVLNASAGQVDFSLDVTNIWEDGFSFRVNPDSTCMNVNLPAGSSVKVGANQVPVSSSFSLNTLSACDSMPGIVTQGEPQIDGASDSGLFMWRINNEWYVKAVAGSGQTTYTGRIDALVNFASVTPISIENGSDVFDFTSNRTDISFELLVTPPWEDTFSFVTSGKTCVRNVIPSQTQLFIGPQRTPVNLPFDLSSLTTSGCQ